MANPRLNDEQLLLANDLLASVREQLGVLSNGNSDLLFAYRRKIAKELMHDERGKPMHRRRIKQLRRMIQEGLCALCREPLPNTHNVLDRIEAKLGYTVQNTRLLCARCDVSVQAERNFA